MTDIPPQAITAAAELHHRLHCTVCPHPTLTCDGEPTELDIAAVRRLLEAAAPHLDAAGRERCAQLAEQAKAEFWTGNRPTLPPCDDLCEFAAEHNEPNDYGRHWHPFATLLREAQP